MEFFTTLEMKPDTFVEPPFSIPKGSDPRLEPDANTGFLTSTAPITLSALSEGKMTAIFGSKRAASGFSDDMDYRCVLVFSRHDGARWLVDREKGTAEKVESGELPEWCWE